VAVLFVADVHLSAHRAGPAERFLRLLCGPARDLERLYLLGDVFDLWLGDDDERAPHPEVTQALRRLTDAGTAVHFLHGNHDFLLGADFVARTGCICLPDAAVVEVFGTPVLVMHGDTLCTDDHDYQDWRAFTRNPDTQRQFLSLTLQERVERAAAVRLEASHKARLKPEEITDVNPAAAERAMREHGVGILVHGHTHRPRVHALQIDGRPAARIVLGDWDREDRVLLWDQRGYRLGPSAELLG
jgi:UDP-2,3-diacylglucosamine hydrolase